MKIKYFIINIFFLVVNVEFSVSQTNGEFWWLTPGKNPVALEKPLAITPVVNTPMVKTSEEKIHENLCCECVIFYLCVNGTIDGSGAGFLDPRIGGTKPPVSTTESPVVNVKLCPNIEEVCCLLPEADPSCMNDLTDHPVTSSSNEVSLNSSSFIPDPTSECECVVYLSCIPDLVVSDGLGNTTILLENGRLVNHSQCRHALDVCCYLPNLGLDLFPLNDTEVPSTVTLIPTKPISEEENCECVEKHLCGADGHIETFGVGVLNPRIGSSNPPKPCPFDPKLVCCLPPKINPAFTTTEATTLPTTATSIPHRECGYRNVFGVGVRILGFSEGQAQFGEYPWVVTVVRKELIMGKIYPLFVGGASLIHPRVVMTAAHKLNGIKIEDLLVRLGEWDSATTKEALPQQEVAIQDIIIHEQYNPGSLFNDVALLILKDEAKLDNHISTICLAKDLKNVDLKSCVINGWGTNAYRTGSYQNIMKSVQLPIVEHNTCQSLLRKTRLSKFFVLHNSFICAGGQQGLDACKGDGGGPLSCPLLDNPLRYVQVGITAWGIGCGEKDVPGVYVNVPHLHQWIEDQIESRFPGYKSTTALIPSTVSMTTAAKTSSTLESREEVIEGLSEIQERKTAKEKNKLERKLKRAEKKSRKIKKRNERKQKWAERKEIRLKNREERKKKTAERKDAKRIIKEGRRRKIEERNVSKRKTEEEKSNKLQND